MSGNQAPKFSLTLDEQELLSLIDLIYLANWMVTANEPVNSQPESIQPYHLLQQKILSLSEIPCRKGIINKENPATEYSYTFDYECKIHEQFIAPYESGIFWDHLISQLADRDIIQQIGLEQYQTMDRDELHRMALEREDYYRKEFAENLYKNIQIKSDTEA